MKNSNRNTILTKIAARVARHLAGAALIAIVVVLPRLACAEAIETTLASFDGTNGHYPTQGLLLASDGNFYGTTPLYGADYGTVFRITPTGTLTTIYRFSGLADEGNPLAALIQGSDGNLYGTTAGGLAFQYGTVFKLTLDGTLTTLFVFTYDSATATWPDGNAPEAALVEGLDGNFYGTTSGGGSQNGGSSALGTIFKMSPAGDLLGSFPVYGFLDIAIPNAPLVLGTNGAFYSTSYNSGGVIGAGAVYQFSAAGVVTVLHGFNDTPDGGTPNGGLVLGSDGNFYGTTQYSGTSHLGTAYRISQGGTYEELISFDSSNGAQPFGQMIQATDGNFYGTTLGGGSHSQGTVFQLTPAGVLTTVYNFTYIGNGDNDAAQPKGTLVQGADGRLYGTSQAGGLYNTGAVFALDLVPQPTLLNISTRLDVQTGDNVLIGGFIITGTQPKQVIVRAIGPTLGGLGVSGALDDPILELHKADGTVMTNDNWKDTQEADIFATGLAPSNDIESAIVATLDPGAYTAIVTGKDNTTGVALVEAYDLDQTVDSQLANISTRGLVQTGDNVMIGGFIVAGNTATVALRAIGPSLGAVGISDPLADPFLELHNSDGDIVDSNDNWMDSPDKQTFVDDGLAPTSEKESVVLGLLAPGGYTAIVSGTNGGTGVALIEAYNLQ